MTYAWIYACTPSYLSVCKLVSLCVALPKCALAVAAQQSCKAMRKTYGSSTRCMPITWCKPRPLSHGIVTSTRTYESNTYQRQHNDVTEQNVVQRTPLEPYGGSFSPGDCQLPWKIRKHARKMQKIASWRPLMHSHFFRMFSACFFVFCVHLVPFPSYIASCLEKCEKMWQRQRTTEYRSNVNQHNVETCPNEWTNTGKANNKHNMHPEQANKRSNERSMPKSDSQIAAKGKHRQQKPTKYCQKRNDNKILTKKWQKNDKNNKHMTNICKT